jgi:hypothetical protein
MSNRSSLRFWISLVALLTVATALAWVATQRVRRAVRAAAAFEQIQEGMTYEEVEALLREPATTGPFGPWGGVTLWVTPDLVIEIDHADIHPTGTCTVVFNKRIRAKSWLGQTILERRS